MAVEASSRFDTDLEAHVRAIQDRDIEAFAATIAPNPLLVGPGGSLLRGYDEVVRTHREWFSSTTFSFETQEIERQERGDAAWALLRVHYRAASDESRFLLLLIFVPVDGKWKLAYDQNTPG